MKPGSRHTVAPETSTASRDRLMREMENVASAEDLAVWAKRALPTKNTLTADDSALIEEAFVAKLNGLVGDDKPAAPASISNLEPTIRSDDAQPQPLGTDASGASSQTADSATAGSDGSTTAVSDPGCAQLAFGKTRRKRDKDHRAFVASKPCLVCGRRPSDAHHLRFAQPRAMGRKVSDEFTVPLCRTHHRGLHQRTDEVAWWQEVRVNPLAVAEQLWQESHGSEAP